MFLKSLSDTSNRHTEGVIVIVECCRPNKDVSSWVSRDEIIIEILAFRTAVRMPLP